MKNPILLAVSAGLLLASTLQAADESLPLKSVNRANEVIDAALEAYGGADTITGLNSLARKSKMITFAANQSFKPGKPWDQNKLVAFNAIDFADEVFRTSNRGSGSGYDFDNGTLINGDDSYRMNYRSGTMTKIAEPDFNTASGPFIRITAPLLVKQLQNRRNTSHWLGETELDGRKHDVVTLVMEVGPALSLYFDQQTHLLTRSERALPPFGQVEYLFSDYETVDGIPFASKFELGVNGDPNILASYISTRVNPPFEQYTALPSGLESVEAAPPATAGVELKEVAEGVFLVGTSGTYAMFVEMDDHIIAVGGTAGIPDRIARLREVISDKPIKYAVLTHHHNDHIVGVAPYQAEGVTVMTVKENEAVVRAAATDSDSLKLEFIDNKHVFRQNGRSLEIHDIGPTPHAEHLLVAWLPKEGVLFEADHFQIPPSGPINPAQPVNLHLAKVIDAKDFKVKSLLSAHSPLVATMADLDKAIARQPVKIASTNSH